MSTNKVVALENNGPVFFRIYLYTVLDEIPGDGQDPKIKKRGERPTGGPLRACLPRSTFALR